MTTPRPNELIVFLRARFDDDEQAARAAKPGPWAYDPGPCEDEVYSAHYGEHGDHVGDTVCYTRGKSHQEANGIHIARWDPDRALTETQTNRWIMEVCEDVTGDHDLSDYERFDWHCDEPITLDVTLTTEALRLLAQPYVSHPDYNPRWNTTTDQLDTQGGV